MEELLKKAQKNAHNWLQNEELDEADRAEINRLLTADDSSELIDCFHQTVGFGTGGLRALRGVGSNRINRYTVGVATQGLSDYLYASFPRQTIRVAIAYDSRRQSDKLAAVTAEALLQNGIAAHVFPALRPTPLLSFAVRYLGCHAGVVITASHNPKEYNGYKVYWRSGIQLLPPHDERLMEKINTLYRAGGIGGKTTWNEPGRQPIRIGEELEEAYFQEVEKLFTNRQAIQRQRDMPIVYSPLHGAGITMVPACLERIGFRNCMIVEAQKYPDGDFPTVQSPNPEEPLAMEKAFLLAEERGAELAMATDPDADRVGMGIRNPQGDFFLLNGNQTLSLLTWFVLRHRTKSISPKKAYILNTIVTTDLVRAIADRYGVECHSTLTGFKYIAKQIDKWEHEKTFLMAGEESCGFLLGDFVRDKDAVSACAFFAYMAACAKEEGKTLYEWLMELYMAYGLYADYLFSRVAKGIVGAQEIRHRMEALRDDALTHIGGEKITRIRDVAAGVEKDLITGQTKQLQLPRAEVLQFYTQKGSKISVRPSGTEPKIKLYIGLKAPLKDPSAYVETLSALEKRAFSMRDELFA